MTEKLNVLCHKVAEMRGLDVVDADQALSALGIDSLNVVDLVLICQEIYPGGANINEMEIDEATSLRGIDEFLASA